MAFLKITRIDKSLPLSRYETEGSCGFDLYARNDIKILPKQIVLIPSNIIVEVPKGYMLVIASRSSTPQKKGLMLPHGIGIIDHDYCGPHDEVKIQVMNFTDREAEIKKGEKIAQGIFVKINKFSFKEVECIKSNSRGGFGSTDNIN